MVDYALIASLSEESYTEVSAEVYLTGIKTCFKKYSKMWFIAINLHRHVEVIEWPGQDSSKMKVYNITTLFGDGEDLTPVTLSFRDLTGDGKPDMLIHIEQQTLVLINDSSTFRPTKPGEVTGLL